MAEAQVKLGYILDPLFQVENTNGKPVVGGHIEVYEAGTNVKYITYQNFDYTQNPFKIPLGSDGRAVVLGDCDLSYDVYIFDSFNNLIVSRLNVAAGDAGGVAGGGLREVIHDETMTGKGTQLSPLGVSPLTNLAVDETMTAYEATVEGKDSLVLGVNGDWFYNQFGSAFSGKVDWSAFYGLKGDISSKADWSALNDYYTRNETYNNFLPRSAIDLNNYYTKDEVFNKSETDTILGFKEDKLYFGYDENSAITSINNSALAGDGNCPWISGTKVIADTQTLTSNMIVQILSSFDLSGYHNHNIGLKGGTYRFPNEYEIGSALLHTNYFMHLSGMSGYLPVSSFSSYTASIANNLQNNWLYTNSAYSLSINNLYNKVDWSAFSAYPAIIDNITNASGNWNEISAFQQNSANYLTGINIPESAGWNEATNVVQTNSAQWAENNNEVNSVVTANSGVWNNVTNKLDTTAFTAWSASMASGGNSFPITGSNGTTSFVANMDCSSVLLTTASRPAGGYVRQTVRGVQYEAYPATDVSASWYNIINGANNRSNCYCIRFTNDMTAADLADYSAYDKVTVVHSNKYTPDCHLYWDGYTKVFPSGLYCELVKGTNDQNQIDWFFTTSGWTNDFWWDWY